MLILIYNVIYILYCICFYEYNNINYDVMIDIYIIIIIDYEFY